MKRLAALLRVATPRILEDTPVLLVDPPSLLEDLPPFLEDSLPLLEDPHSLLEDPSITPFLTSCSPALHVTILEQTVCQPPQSISIHLLEE